jgi:hypothetical protein
MKALFLTFMLVLNLSSAFSQADSIQTQKSTTQHFLKQQILPVSLITAGVMFNIGNIKEKIHEHTPMTNSSFDDFLQYVPAAEIYLFDAFGVKHKNTVFNQTKYLFISQLAAGIIVQTLKKTTEVIRPNGESESFPSGHTTTAFVNATVLFHEFRDNNQWIAYSGFVVATATACLRLTNNDHWLPDVVVGAGIGILTANVVYRLEPLKKLQFSAGSRKISFMPLIGFNSFSFACNF